tara:strand:+ start:267 stop:659 length:393 start_codon:yes stop_codon:yes gene_type:complete
MKGIFVRASDNKVMSIIEADDQETINANLPNGCGFVADVEVDRKRIAFAFFSNDLITYTKTESDLELSQQWAELRGLRDQLLQESDYTQFNDSPLNDSKKTEWATYRQNLRDLPGTVSNPSNVSFPTKPD